MVRAVFWTSLANRRRLGPSVPRSPGPSLARCLRPALPETSAAPLDTAVVSFAPAPGVCGMACTPSAARQQGSRSRGTCLDGRATWRDSRRQRSQRRQRSGACFQAARASKRLARVWLVLVLVHARSGCSLTRSHSLTVGQSEIWLGTRR